MYKEIEKISSEVKKITSSFQMTNLSRQMAKRSSTVIENNLNDSISGSSDESTHISRRQRDGSLIYKK